MQVKYFNLIRMCLKMPAVSHSSVPNLVFSLVLSIKFILVGVMQIITIFMIFFFLNDYQELRQTASKPDVPFKFVHKISYQAPNLEWYSPG